MPPGKPSFQSLDLENLRLLPVFDRFTEGVIIADEDGVIRYYNHAMAKIDDIPKKEALERRVTDIYDFDESQSKILLCLRTEKPVTNHSLLYKTRRGKVVNSIHNVYPLFKKNRLNGAICFVKEYSVLEETVASMVMPRDKKSYSNGTRFTFANIISKNYHYLKAVEMARKTACSPSPVMLFGETGTGKELFAQGIHNQRFKGDRQYMPINCSAIPENLLEGILFGTTKGVFTGAQSRAGLFEKANQGSVFLDEIDAMGRQLQAKILRVVQEKRVRRLGSHEERELDLKIISSVNQPPRASIEAERLREDLFFRLSVVFIAIPPLREHKEDIDLLVDHFVEKQSSAMNKTIAGVTDDVLNLFHHYHWPGNIRELEHVIESAANMVENNMCIGMNHLKSCFFPRSESGTTDLDTAGQPPWKENILSLKELSRLRERQAIQQALEIYGGNISMAAKSLGMSRQLLHYKLKKLPGQHLDL